MNKSMWLFVGIVGVLAISFVVLRMRERSPTDLQVSTMVPNSPAPCYVPVNAPAPRYVPVNAPATNYLNEEVMDITYNDDGLPVKVIIHRKAVMS